MRGALRLWAARSARTGIIPADAGSTGDSHTVFVLRKDHPRGCGEHYILALLLILPLGSSPRMRGARKRHCRFSATTGIIPADAGSTVNSAQWWAFDEDHPRGCGEHTLRIPRLVLYPGSSPRMRGAPGRKVHTPILTGIIPADAGSTP